MLQSPTMARPDTKMLPADGQETDVSYTDSASVTSDSKDYSCCLFHCAHFRVGEFWLCGHWIVHLLQPLVVLIYDISGHPFAVNLGAVSLVSVFIFSFVNMALSYWAVILVGQATSV
jgi:hypothetical protein